MTDTTPHPKPRGLMAVLSVCVLIGIVALLLSIQNAVAIGRESDQRNTDRIAADLAGCERGNVFRQQVIDQAHAVDELITGILDTAFTPGPTATADRREAIAEFRRRLDAPLVAYRKTSDSIRLIDCQAVTPGAKEQP